MSTSAAARDGASRAGILARACLIGASGMGASVTGASVCGFVAPAAADGCAGRLAAFNSAVDAAPAAADASIAALVADPACAGFVIPAQRRLAAARLAAAQKLMAAQAPKAGYMPLILAADAPAVLWQAAATRAEIFFGERRFAEAARAFDRAIDILGNDTMTPKAPTREAVESLVRRAAAARLLAVNEGQGEKGFVAAAATRDGRLGGVFAPRVRGVVPRAVPMPITFDYRSASLTEQGRLAASELARAIREQQPGAVRLVGHTDPRGGQDFNRRLSVARAESVAAFLKQNGVPVAVEAEGVGADEPLQTDGLEGLTQEDRYALDRRVEWRRE
ncbi:OmpA family protein [Methylocella sp.]|uniref:OmpA family protein n=1 Tax=Methylocella sp. TaxID=1978226 RepID=UPI003783A7CA